MCTRERVGRELPEVAWQWLPRIVCSSWATFFHTTCLYHLPESSQPPREASICADPSNTQKESLHEFVRGALPGRGTEGTGARALCSSRLLWCGEATVGPRRKVGSGELPWLGLSWSVLSLSLMTCLLTRGQPRLLWASLS